MPPRGSKQPRSRRVTAKPSTDSAAANDNGEKVATSDAGSPISKRKRAREEGVALVDNSSQGGTKGVHKRQRGRKSDDGRGPEESRTCPYCGKVIVSTYGLNYHIDNFVCRKGERVDQANQTASKATVNKRKRGRGSVGSNKRFRGSKGDRTCPHCRKEFTSVLGRNYHVKHRVCQEQQMDHISGTIAFPTLEKGSKFITNFGVVEVISDDRASSSYKYPENIKTESKNYASYKEKQGVAQRKLYMTYGFHSRLRRMRLMRTYLDGNVTQESTEKAYFGISWLKNFHTELPAPEERVDPLHPSDAHPDRIVVCKLVNDERLRVQPHDDDGNDTEEGTTIKALSSPDATLYLRRRDLTKSYNPEVMIRICPYCGENKSSKEGYKYHLDKQVCVKKAGIRLQQRSEVQNAIENRLHTHIRRHSTRHKKKRIEDAVYPQVWMFLRFSVPPARRAPVEEANDVLLTESRVTKLDETLESLKVQLLRHGALERDRKYGAMYPQVFEALSFSKLANPGTVKRQRRTARLKAEAKLKLQLKREVECLLGGSEEKEDETIDTDDENLEDMEGVAIDSNADVPIIDIQVLIDEAKSGRYPSIQLFEGDHPEFCGLCKEGGELFLCDFCSTAVHFDCLLKKIIVKEPEPEEDFMCHNCARTLMTRRNRAEKRRVQKQEAVIARAGSEKCITPNSHHKNVALSGRELSELMELLDDAKNRLQQISETSKVNSLRRLQIG